ncbi:MAG: hypothetical protein PVH89_14115, partial [Gammaproteobacteria bacterium]
KRCDCYKGSSEPDDRPEVCEYHAAIDGVAYDGEAAFERRHRAMARLEDIYKVEDAKRIEDLGRPALDLSHMRLDDLEEILVAVEWHLAHGHHRPRRRR